MPYIWKIVEHSKKNSNKISRVYVQTKKEKPLLNVVLAGSIDAVCRKLHRCVTHDSKYKDWSLMCCIFR